MADGVINVEAQAMELLWKLLAPLRRRLGWKPLEGHFKLPPYARLARPGRKTALTDSDHWPYGFWSTAARNSGYREWREAWKF